MKKLGSLFETYVIELLFLLDYICSELPLPTDSQRDYNVRMDNKLFFFRIWDFLLKL